MSNSSKQYQKGRIENDTNVKYLHSFLFTRKETFWFTETYLNLQSSPNLFLLGWNVISPHCLQYRPGSWSSVVHVTISCPKIYMEMHKHYDNTPMQYTLIFHGCKLNGNFQIKTCNCFLIFAQNIDRGYRLEPRPCGGSSEYPQSMF